MNHSKSLLQVVILVLSVLFLSACGVFTAQSTPTPISPTSTPIPPTATPIPPTPTPLEEYEEVDPVELDMALEASLQNLEWARGGNIIAVEGTVTGITVSGKSIPLSSGEIVLEDGEAFVVTRDYGKIKLTFSSGFGVIIWLKPSQREQIEELLN